MLRSRGATITAEDDTIYIDPKSAITLDVYEELVDRKDEVLDFLLLTRDVRPDMHGDTFGWSKLFGMAYDLGTGPDSILGVLRGVRCLGAQLERSGKTWKITPSIGQEGWENEDAWQRDRVRWLMPHAKEIARLLATL